jgi:hypothetical protein
MSEAMKEKVNRAVRACLERCIGAADPLVQASAYLEQLRRDPTWTADEVREVEAMILKAVKIVVGQPRNDCCGNQPQSKSIPTATLARFDAPSGSPIPR